VTAAPGALAPENVRKGRVTTGTGEDTPAFPARWFDGLYVISPVNHLVCHRHRRDAQASSATWRQSLGAPGPHDFAVRLRAARQSGTSASTASPPQVRDDRETSLCNEARCAMRDARTIQPILHFEKQKYFWVQGLTGIRRPRPSGKSIRDRTTKHCWNRGAVACRIRWDCLVCAARLPARFISVLPTV